jgi:hypothetical protein
MENDLGTDLEWIAVAHHNTEHPHLHLVIRGVGNDGQSLRFKRDYVKHGIRGIAEDICTRQLGYRTSRDAMEAERREIGEPRFTSLDRAILRDAQKSAPGPDSSYLIIVKNPAQKGLNESARLHLNHVAARLAVLQRMGLAESTAPHTWRFRYDVEEVLRAMQRVSDRQKTLTAHGVPMWDERMPIQMLDMRQLTAVEGRILVHGLDEESGQNYLILEGTDAEVHFVYYTPEMDEARSRGGLLANSFVRLRKVFLAGRPSFGHSRSRRCRKVAEQPPPTGRKCARTSQMWSRTDGRWMGRLAWEISGGSGIRGKRDRPQPRTPVGVVAAAEARPFSRTLIERALKIRKSKR